MHACGCAAPQFNGISGWSAAAHAAQSTQPTRNVSFVQPNQPPPHCCPPHLRPAFSPPHQPPTNRSWGLEIDPEEAKREFFEGSGAGQDGEAGGPSAASQVGRWSEGVGCGVGRGVEWDVMCGWALCVVGCGV